MQEIEEFDMPEGVVDWQDSSTVKFENGIARKTTRRTLKLNDGTEQVLEKVTEREIRVKAPEKREKLAVPAATPSALSDTKEKELDTPERILDDLTNPNEEEEMMMISDALNAADPASYSASRHPSRANFNSTKDLNPMKRESLGAWKEKPEALI